MKLRKKLVVASLALGLVGCGNDENPTPMTGEVDFGLDSLDSYAGNYMESVRAESDAKADQTYPEAFDLVSTQTGIKSQGSRGVCSIFGTVALMEHLYISEGTITEPDFSEQFLLDANRGTFVVRE